MITVGLVKEVFFLAHVFNREVNTTLRVGLEAHPITIQVSPEGIFKIFYKTFHIWTERVEGEGSFFGVESCDTISRIIACIDNGTNWGDMVYHEKD